MKRNNLFHFLDNDPQSKVDYFGLATGKVTVVESHQLNSLVAFGWVIKLRWTPPDSWKGWGSACLPCTRAVWVQINIMKLIITSGWAQISIQVG